MRRDYAKNAGKSRIRNSVIGCWMGKAASSIPNPVSVRSQASGVLDDAELQRFTGDEIESIGRLNDQRQAKLGAFDGLVESDRRWVDLLKLFANPNHGCFKGPRSEE